MRRIACLAAMAATAGLVATALGPAASSGPGAAIAGLDQAEAANGSNPSKIGDNAAKLLSDILGPIIIVMVAAGGLYCFFNRQIGAAVSLAALAFFLGLFVFSPETAQNLIEGFWKRVA